MKRLLIFLGAGAFLLCIVTPLFAQQVDIKSTGWIRVRYRDWNDFLMDDNLAANTTSARNRHYFDTRIRMGVAANIEPGLKGVIEIERTDDWGTHSVFNGNASPSDSTALGTPGGTDSIYFRQAWVDWAIPGTPIHIVGGRMLYTVGGSIVFSGVDNGVDGIQVYSQLGPGTLTGYYFKPQNGGTVTATAGPTGVVTTTSTGDRRFANNDFDMFGGSYKFEWSARNGVEIYGLYSLDKQRAKTIALAATPGICTGAPGDCEQTEEYYIGANFFGVQGPFTYRLEGAYQGGIARKNVAANAALGTSAGDIDRSAGMVVGGASYALVPELALNLDGGWASGDDSLDNTFSNFTGIYGFFQPTLLFAEGNPFGNTANAQFGQNTTNRAIFGTTMGTADMDLAVTTDNNGARFSPGMFYAKPGVKWVPVKQLTINGDVGLLWAAVSPDGVDSYIGTEIDLKAAWQVYKNLVVNTYFAYLIAGDYFERPVANANVTDPWFARVEFIFTF